MAKVLELTMVILYGMAVCLVIAYLMALCKWIEISDQLVAGHAVCLGIVVFMTTILALVHHVLLEQTVSER